MSTPDLEPTRTRQLADAPTLDDMILQIDANLPATPKETVKTGVFRKNIFRVLVGGTIALLGADAANQTLKLNDLRGRNYAIQPDDFGSRIILGGCIMDCQKPAAPKECFDAALALAKMLEAQGGGAMKKIADAAMIRFGNEPDVLSGILQTTSQATVRPVDSLQEEGGMKSKVIRLLTGGNAPDNTLGVQMLLDGLRHATEKLSDPDLPEEKRDRFAGMTIGLLGTLQGVDITYDERDFLFALLKDVEVTGRFKDEYAIAKTNVFKGPPQQ